MSAIVKENQRTMWCENNGHCQSGFVHVVQIKCINTRIRIGTSTRYDTNINIECGY